MVRRLVWLIPLTLGGWLIAYIAAPQWLWELVIPSPVTIREADVRSVEVQALLAIAVHGRSRLLSPLPSQGRAKLVTNRWFSWRGKRGETMLLWEDAPRLTLELMRLPAHNRAWYFSTPPQCSTPT